MSKVKISELSDSELIDVVEIVYTAMNANPADYPGVTAGQLTDLLTKRGNFSNAVNAQTAAQADAKSKTTAKNVSRDELEELLRTLRNIAIANGATQAALDALGIPSAGDLPSTATRPVAIVDTSQRFVHTIRFADEAAPNIKRLPRGVLGCEIYQKIGGVPPTDFNECVFRGLDTKTPYTWEFDAEDVGKMVHYMLRWRLRDESASAWSETVSATVTG